MIEARDLRLFVLRGSISIELAPLGTTIPAAPVLFLGTTRSNALSTDADTLASDTTREKTLLLAMFKGAIDSKEKGSSSDAMQLFFFLFDAPLGVCGAKRRNLWDIRIHLETYICRLTGQEGGHHQSWMNSC